MKTADGVEIVDGMDVYTLVTTQNNSLFNRKAILARKVYVVDNKVYWMGCPYMADQFFFSVDAANRQIRREYDDLMEDIRVLYGAAVAKLNTASIV